MMIRKFALYKVKGGVLYFTLLVCIINVLFLTTFILLGRQNQRVVSDLVRLHQLSLSLESAVAMGTSDYYSAELNNRWIKGNGPNDSVRLNVTSWGAFKVVTACAKSKRNLVNHSGVYAGFMTPDTSMVIADAGRQISMAGKSEFETNVYIPGKDVRRTTINGQSFQGKPLFPGQIHPAPAAIQPPASQFLQSLIDQQVSDSYGDSIVFILPENFKQSFAGPVVVYQHPTGIIENDVLIGNIRLRAPEFVLDSTCKLEGVSIVARKVRIKSGFKGSVHIIVSDSLIVEKRCELNYPSSLVLLNSGSANNMSIVTIDEFSRVWGAIIAVSKSIGTAGNRTFVRLPAHGLVAGLVYCDGYAQPAGEIAGTLIAKALLLNTGSAVYENHFFNCEIKPTAYASILGVPDIFGNGKAMICCAQLQ